jgi:hypothetical protein
MARRTRFLILAAVAGAAARGIGAQQPSTPTPRDSAEASGLPPDSATSHQWAPDAPDHVELGVNFGLLQLGLHGFNIAGELRYQRLWLEYSHGMDLTLNSLPALTMTSAERNQDLHIYLPYTTGFEKLSLA